MENGAINVCVKLLFESYGYLLPVEKPTDGATFAKLIKESYDIENERNAFFYNFAGSMTKPIVKKIDGSIRLACQ